MQNSKMKNPTPVALKREGRQRKTKNLYVFLKL